jgi:DNA adenine methylase
MRAKPFLKWAGGKTQLIEQIKEQLPQNIQQNNFTYIEPFVGSGAVLFWMLEQFPNMENAVINDINKDLTNSYKTIKNDVQNLISILSGWEIEYYNFADNQEAKKEYYYEKRALFNTRNSDQTTQSALFIFLNRTCFNGLYRVNRKNEFNVPIGSYKKPQICNTENLLAVSEVLQRVEILNGDYSETVQYATKNTFFYFDPPYKPLSETSSFNSYAKDEFDDQEQIRLKEFCDTLNDQGHQWILSNSDVKGKDPNNNFFDDLFANFNIMRVNARRSINANPSKRGKLTELLVVNIQSLRIDKVNLNN